MLIGYFCRSLIFSYAGDMTSSTFTISSQYNRSPGDPVFSALNIKKAAVLGLTGFGLISVTVMTFRSTVSAASASVVDWPIAVPSGLRTASVQKLDASLVEETSMIASTE